jgi:hypothetical protein
MKSVVAPSATIGSLSCWKIRQPKGTGEPSWHSASCALPSAEWSVELGEEPAWLAKYGRTADLLVIGRGREGKAVAMDVLSACLMETGRPMLIAPAKLSSRLSGTVAIAWKNRPEAARAVAAAQPFLEMATQVAIFCVDEGAQDDEQSRERLRHALSWHNPHTTVQTLTWISQTRASQDGEPGPVSGNLVA